MAGAALDHHGLGSRAESGLGRAAGALCADHRHLSFIEGSTEQHTFTADTLTLKASLSSLGTPRGQSPGIHSSLFNQEEYLHGAHGRSDA